jgi:ComF family protein
MQITARGLFAVLARPARLTLDLALPPRCPGCGLVTMADHLFCVDCWQTLDFLNGPACRTCGDPFVLDPGAPAQCGACIADPPAIDGMRAAVAYGEIAKALALKLKYGKRPGMAVTLARQMRRLMGDGDALVTPVPLHRWRLWRRGYNQAALIGGALTRDTRQPFIPDLLMRVKATPVLRSMGPAARKKAVRGAFRITPRYAEQIKDRDIILIDDVYTTGATANACAAALKRAGAASVRVCCWARVVRDIDNGAAR